MSFPTNLNAVDSEWQAWQIVMKELKNTLRHAGMEHPDPDSPTCTLLVRAVEMWGEMLVDLRVNQEEDEREAARQEKVSAYLALS